MIILIQSQHAAILDDSMKSFTGSRKEEMKRQTACAIENGAKIVHFKSFKMWRSKSEWHQYAIRPRGTLCAPAETTGTVSAHSAYNTMNQTETKYVWHKIQFPVTVPPKRKRVHRLATSWDKLKRPSVILLGLAGKWKGLRQVINVQDFHLIKFWHPTFMFWAWKHSWCLAHAQTNYLRVSKSSLRCPCSECLSSLRRGGKARRKPVFLITPCSVDQKVL